MDVAFRRLTDDDLPMLHGWLNEPGVVRWWEGDDVSWEGVVRDYGSAREDVWTEHHLALFDGEPGGWIQCYAVADSPEEAAAWLPHGVHATAAGIDYLVADPAGRGRGRGTAMIGAFVASVVFGRHPDWTQAAASPHVDNIGSWRALEKAGFRHVVDVADEEGPWRLMVIDRPRSRERNPG